jgi:hypothetical protein
MKSSTRGGPRRAKFKVEVVFLVANYSPLADETEIVFALAVNGTLASRTSQAGRITLITVARPADSPVSKSSSDRSNEVGCSFGLGNLRAPSVAVTVPVLVVVYCVLREYQALLGFVTKLDIKLKL